MMLFVRIVFLVRGSYIRNNLYPSTNWKCVSRDYGRNVSGVKGVYIRMLFAHHPIVRFIIGGSKRRKIMLPKFQYWNDLIWNGKMSRLIRYCDGQIYCFCSMA